MPGCLGLDALWQLVGFYLAWIGNPGHGRALGVGEVKFTGQVLPTAHTVSYHIDMKRVITRKLVLGSATGWCRWTDAPSTRPKTCGWGSSPPPRGSKGRLGTPQRHAPQPREPITSRKPPATPAPRRLVNPSKRSRFLV
jgi:hypothetical protein